MSKTHFHHLLVLILVYIVEAKSELRRILMHIYEFERSKEEQGAFSAPLAYYPESPFPFILRAFVQKCSCCCCREKMRPKMYFLRASHKSPQMFLAGYFIGASDRWSWWKKKMVLSQFVATKPPPTPTTYFRDVPCGRRSPPRRTTRQRHHPQLGSKLSYLALEHKPAMHMDEGIQYNRPES